MIYCGGVKLVHFSDPFRQIATAILLKRSKTVLNFPLASLRSLKSDRLLDQKIAPDFNLVAFRITDAQLDGYAIAVARDDHIDIQRL